MPSASLVSLAWFAALRRALVVLLVLGALCGAAPAAQAAVGRDTVAVSVTPEPSAETTPDAADAVLPPQSSRVARQIRPSVGAAEQGPRPGAPAFIPYDNARRRPAAATGVRCVVLRC
ncbi:hypothetical protein ACGFW5_05165 [Streptomyces sp. NPDC048416]|uniref:hypothetical protein n=1 Tax=Streptomyces sp. NPDC048416 TaxID=3365546 RepID=UPI00371BC631